MLNVNLSINYQQYKRIDLGTLFICSMHLQAKYYNYRLLDLILATLDVIYIL